MITTDVQQLSERFNRCFETLEADHGLFADNTFFDLLPPMWRFQMRGDGDAFAGQLRTISNGAFVRGEDHPHNRHGDRLRHGVRGASRDG